MGLKPRAPSAAAITAFARGRLARAADPEKAGPMAAYMKTEMPFYGVQRPDREPIARALARFELPNRRAYERAVLGLWRLPHREEKYLALDLAQRRREFIHIESLPLYERLIREGGWWDLVDPVATRLVGAVLRRHPEQTWPVLERWIDDRDLWIRRTALLAQLHHGAATDAERLFRFCLRRAGEPEFFIRKAIGWALRSYSYAAPEAVRDFLLAHRRELSSLSFREGAKRLPDMLTARF